MIGGKFVAEMGGERDNCGAATTTRKSTIAIAIPKAC